jgi:hypothetical protein
MSTFIGKIGAKPTCHMTSDTKTQAELEVGPINSTIFHSDLPYVFVKKRFTLDSYTTWSGSGRTFAFSTDLINYKDANPELACLVYLEDSSGRMTMHTPVPYMNLGWFYFAGYTDTTWNCSIVGQPYSVAFTNSDAQLTALTRQTVGSQASTFATTFYTFDTNDTRVTVFNHLYMGGYTSNSGIQASSALLEFTNGTVQPPGSSTPWVLESPAGDLESLAGNDIVKVHFAFLNVVNDQTTFDIQKDYNGTSSITLANNTFSVGSLDLLVQTPLIGHGIKNTTSPSVSALIGGDLVGGVPAIYTSGANPVTGKVTTGGAVTQNSTPVLEIPDIGSPTGSMVFDFENQVFSRDGVDIFSGASAALGLKRLGAVELDIDFESGTVTGNNDNYITLATSTGQFPNATEDSIYLVSSVYIPLGSTTSGDYQPLPTCVFSVGSNRLFHIFYNLYGYFTRLSSSRFYAGMCPTWLCDIDSTGNVTIKRHVKSYAYRNISNLSGDFGGMKIRIIGLG